MPAVESGAVNNMWFSFDYGLVHFISIDTEVDYPNSPEGPGTWGNAGPFGDQLGWLEADLKKAVANRANVPWILVSGHRPFYSSSAEGLWPPSQQWFEPLFNEYNVDIVYWGHIHWSAEYTHIAAATFAVYRQPTSIRFLRTYRARVSCVVLARYERMWPTATNSSVVQQDYNDPSAPVYFISASAGNVEGLTPGNITQPYSALVDDSEFGMGLLRVHNATHLSWHFYRSSDKKLIDRVEIVQQKRWETLHADSQQSEQELHVQSE